MSTPTTTGRPPAGNHRPRRLGIDTGPEHVAYLHEHSPVCRSEGFGAHSRLELRLGDRKSAQRVTITALGRRQRP